MPMTKWEDAWPWIQEQNDPTSEMLVRHYLDNAYAADAWREIMHEEQEPGAPDAESHWLYYRAMRIQMHILIKEWYRRNNA